jgi:hypothetical protein
MRHTLYFILTGMLALTIGCEEDEPNYPIEPFIEFKSLTFQNTAAAHLYDTLKLTINYRDGDGDLGLDYSEINPPFHSTNYFLAKDGVLYPVGIYMGTTNENPPRIFSPVLEVQPDQDGKLATIHTRDLGYDIPLLEFPYTCSNYTGLDDSLYLLRKDDRILDATHTITEVIPIGDTELLKISGSNFYFERNPNHYNIFVDYLVEQPNGSFQEFDWEKEFCTSFDGRFPVVSTLPKGLSISGPFDVRKKSKSEGSITYNMASVGFIPLFQGKRLKLRVSIKDRALHTSNSIETNVIQF